MLSRCSCSTTSAGELLEQPIYGNTEMGVLESFVEEKDPMIGRRLGSYRIERDR